MTLEIIVGIIITVGALPFAVVSFLEGLERCAR